MNSESGVASGRKGKHGPFVAGVAAVILAVAAGATEPAPGSAPAGWAHGPPQDPSFFPIAVWLQPPDKAGAYLAAGVNTYVGLWEGPTEEQLAALKRAGMKLVCEQNEVARRHLDDPTIVGWMHGDEPDNAQELPNHKGYGPPIAPEQIVKDYRRIRDADPARPVLLNLGQGVAWNDYIGRGVRRNHPEDYVAYVQGCDIASFDIYPVVHDHPAVSGQLWFVAQGVERLRGWAGPGRTVWNCIECTRIGSPDRKATPHQVRAEVWMSLVRGSRGQIYFVHEWKPRFNESALLADPEMLAAVTAINREVRELAPVLNDPGPWSPVSVASANAAVPVAAMARGHDGGQYLFAVGMRDGSTSAGFTLSGLRGETPVEVLGEHRTLPARDGMFHDDFKPWDVHLYRLPAPERKP